jgi:hypothetical protein
MEENGGSTDSGRRRERVTADDVLTRLLDVAEGTYECVTVKNSWPEKGLMEGDVALITPGVPATAGSVVLIESEGATRLGLMSGAGWLATPYGDRPMDATETIIGAAIALVRKLGA